MNTQKWLQVSLAVFFFVMTLVAAHVMCGSGYYTFEMTINHEFPDRIVEKIDKLLEKQIELTEKEIRETGNSGYSYSIVPDDPFTTPQRPQVPDSSPKPSDAPLYNYEPAPSYDYSEEPKIPFRRKEKAEEPVIPRRTPIEPLQPEQPRAQKHTQSAGVIREADPWPETVVFPEGTRMLQQPVDFSLPDMRLY